MNPARSDLEWLGLEAHDDGRYSFVLASALTRFDGKLYGGTGAAVVTALLEAETGRDALWVTAQFAGSADLDEVLDCRVEVLAHGRRTSQARVTVSVGGRVAVVGLGATGAPRSGALEAQFGAMPDVDPPEHAKRWIPKLPFPVHGERPGWLAISEMRETDAEAGGDTRSAFWARMRDVDVTTQTRATIAFLTDVVPSSVVRAAGRTGGGTSLDNALRFGPRPDGEWILVEFDPYLASAGYVHGAARVWSRDGRLLAVASQTAVARVFE